MILPQDALLLSFTKLKTRRVRLLITIVVAGILFVLLTASSLVANGFFSSIEQFSEERLGKRFIVSVIPMTTLEESSPAGSTEEVAEVKAAFEQLKKDKAAAAKALDVMYDPLTEPSPILPDTGFGKEGVDDFHEVVIKLRAQKQNQATAQEQRYAAAIKEAEEVYGAIATHRSSSLGASFGGPTAGGYHRTVIIDGKENVNQGVDDQAMNMSFGPVEGVKGVEQGLETFSDEVLTEFLLPGQSLESKDGTIPIVVPNKAGEEIIGLSSLKANANSTERLDRLKQLRSTIAGKTFQICLRNSASFNRQTEAVQAQKDFAANKDKKDYVKPDVLRAVSEQPCQDVVVTRDVRTAEQKKYDANFEQFERQFGKPAPTQRIVTFKVVGLAPDLPNPTGFGITDIVRDVLVSYVGQGWYVPLSASESLPEYNNDFSKPLTKVDFFSMNQVYVEFADAEAARRFIAEKSCNATYGPDTTVDPIEQCLEDGQPIAAVPFGSNSLALEQARSGFRSFFPKVLLGVAVVSALIMMGTVGKIISDGRRETAVFRAIGAKRLDVAQIYLTYTLILAALISLVSLGIGLLLAMYVQSEYAQRLSVEAIVSFNSEDLERKFNLIAIDPTQLGMLLAVIIGGSLLSALIPLISNLRRNPIRDMRDER